MNVPIRFRGKCVDTGEYVYGDFVHRGPLESKPGIIDDEDFYNEIDPDSVAQLCGYDRDGNEVYEGDILVGTYNNEWTAVLVHAPVTDDDFQIIVPTKIFTLKVAES